MADMSDAQFTALDTADRGTGYIARGAAASSATLIAMARNKWVDKVTTCATVGGRDVYTLAGAWLNARGRRALVLARAQRAQAARNATLVRVGVAARVDPFAVFAPRKPEISIPF